MLIWKAVFIDDAIHCVISNFDKKKCSIVKTFSPEFLRFVSFFHERVSCVKKGT